MRKYTVFVILLSLLIPATMAATVTISPTSIESGDIVTVDTKGISDGAKFSLSIKGEFDVIPGETFAFTARDLTLPFSLDAGEVGAYTRGTIWTGLSAKHGGTSLSLSSKSDEKGEYQTCRPYDISKGTYEFITLDGKAASTTTIITAKMTMSGKRKGSGDGKITFALDGIEHGTATVAVAVGGEDVLEQKITIKSSSSGSSGSAGSTGGSGGSPGSGSSGSPGQPYPQDPSPRTTTAPTDGKPSLIGADTEDVEIRALAAEGALPAGWSMAERAYSVTPTGHSLNAALSFPAPNTTATIARLEGDTWVIIPSKIEENRITAEITVGGSYAVLVPAGASARPTTSITATTTPAPVATTPAATPLPALLPALACAILILVQSRRG